MSFEKKFSSDYRPWLPASLNPSRALWRSPGAPQHVVSPDIEREAFLAVDPLAVTDICEQWPITSSGPKGGV